MIAAYTKKIFVGRRCCGGMRRHSRESTHSNANRSLRVRQDDLVHGASRPQQQQSVRHNTVSNPYQHLMVEPVDDWDDFAPDSLDVVDEPDWDTQDSLDGVLPRSISAPVDPVNPMLGTGALVPSLSGPVIAMNDNTTPVSVPCDKHQLPKKPQR